MMEIDDENMKGLRGPQGNDGYRRRRVGIPYLGEDGMPLIRVPSFPKLTERASW